MTLSNWINSLGTVFFVFGGGVTVGIFIVSNWMKKDMLQIKEDTQNTNKIIENYERNYYDEFINMEELDHNEEFLKNLQNKWTIENTPCGEIIMTYMNDYESFWFYSDRRNVSYKTLDTVARKFAIDNNCKSVCVNYKEEFDKGKNAILKRHEKQFKDNVDETNSSKIKKPFAVFKSYNMKKSIASNKKYIITKNANRFTYKGNTSDWIDPTELSNTTCNDMSLSYADFINRKIQ